MFTFIARFFHNWKRYDDAMQELSHLSERELADIGISRCDIPRLAREHAAAEMAVASVPSLRAAKPRFVQSPAGDESRFASARSAAEAFASRNEATRVSVSGAVRRWQRQR